MNFFYQVLVGMFVLLASGSLVSWMLLNIKPQNETFKKVRVIVGSWWIILTPILIALLWPKWGMLLFFYFLSLFILREYFRNSKIEHKAQGFWMTATVATLQYLCLAVGSFDLFVICTPLLALLVVPAFVIFSATIRDLPLVFAALFGPCFLIYYLSHVPALVAMPDKLGLEYEQAAIGVLVFLGLTWGNDIFQFICGKAFGKRKIVPHVSPNKTLGGFVGGFICTSLLSFVTLKPLMGLEWSEVLILGPAMSFLGMLGDLFFSAIKRHLGTKDFSDLLPGHGGLLDRCDSVIFSAPVFFHLLKLIHKGYL